MRKLSFVSLCVVALCGFGPAPFDLGAVAKAKAAWIAANTACFARTDYNTASGIIVCLAAADRGFALAIHMADQKPLDAYSTQLSLVTADADTGKLAPSEAVHRFRDAQSRLFKAITSQYDAYEADMTQDFTDQAHRSDPPSGMGMGGMNNGMGMGGMGGM
jgi:hypothetical protein